MRGGAPVEQHGPLARVQGDVVLRQRVEAPAEGLRPRLQNRLSRTADREWNPRRSSVGATSARLPLHRTEGGAAGAPLPPRTSAL